MTSAQASAILISAPASRQGKTTVTAALARQAARESKRGEAVFRKSAVTARYIHFYFPSNPRAAAALFRP